MNKAPRLPLTLFLAGATALTATSLSAFEPNDPLYARQWQWNPLKNGIHITGAWKDGYTGAGVVIGIIDQWVDPEHPDLRGNYSFELSKNFATPDPNEPKYDGLTHGTFVAGMAAAVGGNKIGVTGAAPHATLAGLHIGLDGRFNGGQMDDWISQAFFEGSGISGNPLAAAPNISFLSDPTISIKNCSFGPAQSLFLIAPNPRDVEIIKKSSLNNVIYLFAAGNDRNDTGQTTSFSTAGAHQIIEDVIVVAATNTRGTYTNFSNNGSNVFVCAPGQDVLSTTRGEMEQEVEGDTPEDERQDFGENTLYTTNSGTSFSTPTVAGVVALAKQSNIGMDARWAKHAIAHTSEVRDTMRAESPTGEWLTNSGGLEFSNDYGFGIVNADEFVKFANNIAYTTIRTGSEYRVELGNSRTWKADAENPLTGTIKMTEADLDQNIESVELSINIANINFYQDAKITIVSPSGMRSVVLDTSTLTPEAAAQFWAVARTPGQLGEDGRLIWSFTSNAFWGSDAKSEVGDWKVEFLNKGQNNATVTNASLKFNLGTFVMESENMSVPDNGKDSLDIHTLAIHNVSTNFTVQKGKTLKVEDSVVVNGGNLRVQGNLLPYTENWGLQNYKGVKVHQYGGGIRLEQGGNLEATRGADIYGGNFVLAGGSLTGKGEIAIKGGTLRVETSSSIAQAITLSAGRLDTSALAGAGATSNFTAGRVSVLGGEFAAGGDNRLAVSAKGGIVSIAGEGVTKFSSIEVAASAENKTVGTIAVRRGSILSVPSSALSLNGIYQAESTDAEGNIVPAINLRPYAEIGGTVDAKVVAKDALIYTSSSSAKFLKSVNVEAGAYFNVGGNLEINGGTTSSPALTIKGERIKKDGQDEVVRSGEVCLANNAVIKTNSNLEVQRDGVLYVGGLTAGTTTIESTSNKAISVKGGTLKLEVGDKLVLKHLTGNAVGSGTIEFRKDDAGNRALIDLEFQDQLPMDTISFIDGNASVVQDSVDLRLLGNVPTIWNGKEEIGIGVASDNDAACYYDLLSDGTIKLKWADGANPSNLLSLTPLRLTYDSMTPAQKAVAGALRTCLPEGANAGTSADIIAEVEKFQSISQLQNFYNQFLPVSLVTINNLHNKQANAITGTIDRRSRELRNGAPTADIWSTPLLNSYSFSYSANPNLVAASGFREFTGYDYDVPFMVWANGGHSFSDGKKQDNTGESKNKLTNASLGFDYALQDLISFGAFVSYSQGETKLKETGTKTEADLRGIGIYLAGSNNNSIGSFYYTAMVSYGATDYKFSRTIVAGAYTDTAKASPNGSQFIGYIATGYEWLAGSQATGVQWTTGPSVSLRYTYNTIDGYTESGEGINSLKVDEFKYDSLLASIGWRTSVRCNIKDTLTFVPELRLSWQKEFYDGNETINSSFALANSELSTSMNKVGKDYGTVGLGLSFLITESLTLSFDYDVNFYSKDSDPEHNFNAMLRCRF